MALTTTWALAKVLLWAGLIFWFLARKIFAPQGTGSTALASVIKMAFSSVVIVHGLALLEMLDAASLVVSFAALGLGRVWHRDRSRIGVALQGFSARAHIFIYNILDGYVGLRAFAHRHAIAALLHLRSTGALLWRSAPQTLALTFVIGGVILLKLPGLSRYPFPETAREFAHLDILKSLGAGELASAGFYPTGAHALGVVLRTFTLLDEALLWKVVGIALAVCSSLIAFCGVRSIAGDKSFGPALLASGLAALFGGSALLGGEPHVTEVHPWHFAAPLLALAVVFNAQSLRKPGDLWTCAAAAGLVGFVHPLAWLALFAAVVVSSGAMVAFGLRGARALALVSMSVSGAILPFLWGGIAWSVRGFRDQDMVWRELTAVAPATVSAEQVPMLVAGAAAAIVLILLPSSGGNQEPTGPPQILGALYLGCWSLTALPRFNLPQVLSDQGLLVLTAPLAAICVGVALQRCGAWLSPWMSRITGFTKASRWQTAPAMIALGVLLLVYPPELAEAQRHPEPADALIAYERIRDSIVAGTWTVVGHPELIYHTKGYGWHMPREDFLTRYPVQSYRWDPRSPETAIPSPHTFFLVEKFTPPDLAQDDISSTERASISQQLAQWCRTYRKRADDMTVFFENASIVVYHLERTRERERELLNRIWAEENRQSSQKGEAL